MPARRLMLLLVPGTPLQQCMGWRFVSSLWGGQTRSELQQSQFRCGCAGSMLFWKTSECFG